jgi:hypothetical protein
MHEPSGRNLFVWLAGSARWPAGWLIDAQCERLRSFAQAAVAIKVDRAPSSLQDFQALCLQAFQ